MFTLARTVVGGFVRNYLPRRLLTPNTGKRFITMSHEGRELGIPIIDIGKLGLDHDPSDGDAEWERVAQEITYAFENIGFAYIKGHGFPQAQVDRLTQAGAKFFDLNVEEKLKYNRDLEKLHGYLPINAEQLDSNYSFELREAYDLRNASDLFFPDEAIPDFRPATADYLESCRRLTNRLLVPVAIGLDLPQRFFLEAHKHIGDPGNGTIGRVIHYPPVPDGTRPGTIRIAPHSDITTFTLLFQDKIGGLQILNEKGDWCDAPPVPGAIVVNIGDLLHFWTQGRLKATKHRVVIPQDEAKTSISRRSMTYFALLDDDTIIKPLDGSSTFEPIGMKDYLQMRLKEIYQQ